MTRFLLAAIILASTGCASWSPFSASRLLDRADALVQVGDYRGALPVYEEFLTKYPEHSAALRARTSRALITGFLGARAEIERLQRQTAHRDAELARLRAEIARLTAEADRLRADLEKLKSLDIKTERRRAR